MRLDKLVTGAGLSRSEAKKAIRDGRVAENGIAVRDPSVNADGRSFTLDGKPLFPAGHITLLLNKPAGIVSATRDGKYDDLYKLLPEEVVRRKPGPCGRLDKDVTGVMLMTTDGQLAHRIISPSRGIEKVYEARVEGRIDPESVRRMEEGIAFKDYTSKPAEVTVLEAGDGESLIRIAVTEGKYHEVKKICAAVGHGVIALKRVEEAGICLGDLREGEWRYLTEDETDALMKKVGLKDE